MKQQPSKNTSSSPSRRDDIKYGFPGNAKERRARIRAAIKMHAETLRRLAE